MTNQSDYLIIGGGIMGLAVARRLRAQYASASITLIDKEADVAQHASGRNSGVLHAGFYYSADSLKARFCRDGNRRLRAYCRERGLPLRECGKLVVAKHARELNGLDELYRRGRANGVKLEMISLQDARRIEPRVRSHDRVLWSPDTASADPLAVIASLARDAGDLGVGILLSTAYRSGSP